MVPIQPGDVRTSSLSRGRCFVYVLPCAGEDILKLGFSRDPLGRLRSLHRRYFEFFDLEQAFLIETETVRDARRIELALGRAVAAHNAPSPLVVRRPAAGHTEWYRGAYGTLRQQAGILRDAGHHLHDPAMPWIRDRLIDGDDALYAWAHTMLEGLEDFAGDDVTAPALRRTLLDALDAYPAMDIALEPLLPPRVWQWYRRRGVGDS